jgi:hypothetical protein
LQHIGPAFQYGMLLAPAPLSQDRPMIRPIQLRTELLLRRAKMVTAGDKDGAAERRRVRLAGYKALRAVEACYALEEPIITRRDEFEQVQWQKRRELVEAELRRIAGVKEDLP